MDDRIFIEEVKYNCPICEEVHKVKVYKEPTKALVKKQPVEYIETYYYCPISEEEFYPSQILNNNLLEARDSYRRNNNLLTSTEIKEIRKFYGLNQKEFSNIFGWGDITIQRYETKLIQEETYNEMIKRAKDDPLFLYEELKKHKDKFEVNRFREIEDLLKDEIRKKQYIHLNKECLKALYLDHETPSEFNGNKVLNFEKIEQMLRFFSQFNRHLYKTKLMKLLWYSDAYHYKEYGESISGLVYQHLQYGAVPIGSNEVLGASGNSIAIVEENLGCKDDGEELIGQRITNLKKIDKQRLETSEISVLEIINKKFKGLGSSAISNRMHEEEAYKKTGDKDLISFKWAETLNIF
jgi:putative zinc finger/helix-turn-helix YgiT family protein